jgi:hypothetical protein
MIDLFKNKKVAIVGNSQSIFQKSYGNMIDDHDIVCRINRGIILKDEMSQGTKTDVWTYGDFSIVQDLFEIYNIEHTIHLSAVKRLTTIKGTEEKQFEKYPYTKYYVPLDELDQLVKKINSIDRFEPSSGLILINCVHLRDSNSISLFGFDWKKEKTWYNDTEDVLSNHNWDLEKKFILNNYNNITVY